jgi:Fe-S-cluster containining protein
VNDQETPLKVNGLTISPGLFRRGYPAGSGPCTCTSTCCRGGVYADLSERDAILRHRDMIKQHMDETQLSDESLWFEEKETDDRDFASGKCIGTTEHNGKCVFLDRQGRCSVQVASVHAGMDRWAIKPLFCILFPIEITNGVVSFDDLLQDDQPCCSVGDTFETPIFRACRDELTHLLGAEGYERLEEHYRSLTRQPAPRVAVRTGQA